MTLGGQLREHPVRLFDRKRSLHRGFGGCDAAAVLPEGREQLALPAAGRRKSLSLPREPRDSPPQTCGGAQHEGEAGREDARGGDNEDRGDEEPDPERHGYVGGGARFLQFFPSEILQIAHHLPALLPVWIPGQFYCAASGAAKRVALRSDSKKV